MRPRCRGRSGTPVSAALRSPRHRSDPPIVPPRTALLQSRHYSGCTRPTCLKAVKIEVQTTTCCGVSRMHVATSMCAQNKAYTERPPERLHKIQARNGAPEEPGVNVHASLADTGCGSSDVLVPVEQSSRMVVRVPSSWVLEPTTVHRVYRYSILILCHYAKSLYTCVHGSPKSIIL